MIIEALHPLHIRRAAGDLHLRPGVPIDLPDDQAERLLAKLPDKVRRLERTTQIEPAASNARPIYWETGSGRILGPAIPEFLARDGETFWVVTTFEGQVRWINADQLRSKREFEKQVPVHEVEPIRF